MHDGNEAADYSVPQAQEYKISHYSTGTIIGTSAENLSTSIGKDSDNNHEILFERIADAAIISMLFAISAIACFVLSPWVGKLIDRIGYKTVMIADTLLLVIVCFFYGFAHHLFSMETAFIVCCVNYVMDSVISLASMASNVYVQDISDNQEEMRATISTGISVNHLITVFIALLGGWVWNVLGIETLFIVSAFLGLCNSAYAATIKPKRQMADAG